MEKRKAKHEGGARLERRPLKVLVVEDDEGQQKLFELAVRHYGHQAEVAGDYQDALHKIAETEFDLGFIDLHLPGGSGLDLIMEFNRTSPGTPLVAMTGGVSSREQELQVRQQKIIYLLLKPFALQELQEILGHVSARNQQGRLLSSM